MERRKSSGLASLRAVAMTPNRSVSSWRMSAREGTTNSGATRNMRRRMRSGPVTGVDLDVALGEVAGPEAGGAFTLSTNRETDLTLLGFELLLEGGLGERGGQSCAADGGILQIDIDFGGVERVTGIPGGGEDASPVWIGSGHSSLNERRVGDRTRD